MKVQLKLGPGGMRKDGFHGTSISYSMCTEQRQKQRLTGCLLERRSGGVFDTSGLCNESNPVWRWDPFSLACASPGCASHLQCGMPAWMKTALSCNITNGGSKKNTIMALITRRRLRLVAFECHLSEDSETKRQDWNDPRSLGEPSN